MDTRPLNNNQLRFVAEYLAEMPRNARAAYLRVYECADSTADAASSRMLNEPRVQAEIARWEQQLRADLQLEAKDVLREIALVATADPREITEHYRGACRHCWGIHFKYQRRPSEYERDLADYLASNAARAKKGEVPPDPLGLNFPIMGGVGFSTRKAPNPDCPECDGDGESYEQMKDTRALSPGAARLFESVERTRNGLKIHIRNREKALDLAAQHLGISRKAVELTGKNGGPVQSVTAGVSLRDVDPTTAAQLYQSLIGGA